MDINIKYKEIDKVAAVHKLLMGNSVLPSKLMLAKAIDAIYKEDSKQIERVEIGNCKNAVAGMDIEVFKDMARIGIRVGFKTQFMETNKTGLDEIIKVLTDISNQLEG
jgi:hypothetical protein